MIMVVVIKHWAKIRESKRLEDLVGQIAEGKLQHAKGILMELLRRAALTAPPEVPAYMWFKLLYRFRRYCSTIPFFLGSRVVHLITINPDICEPHHSLFVQDVGHSIGNEQLFPVYIQYKLRKYTVQTRTVQLRTYLSWCIVVHQCCLEGVFECLLTGSEYRGFPVY